MHYIIVGKKKLADDDEPTSRLRLLGDRIHAEVSSEKSSASSVIVVDDLNMLLNVHESCDVLDFCVSLRRMCWRDEVFFYFFLPFVWC